MKNTIFIFCLSMVLFSCSEKKESTSDESATSKANAIYQAYFDELVDLQPQYQTQLGIKKDYGKWNDISDSAQVNILMLKEKYFKKLRDSVDYDQLDDVARLAYDNFEIMNRKLTDEIRYRFYNYPVNQMYGLQTTVVTTLTNSHRIDSLKDARDYISRVEGISPLFDQLLVNLKIREDSGVVLPRHLYDQVVNVCENLLADLDSDVKKHVLYQDFKGKIEKLGLSSGEAEALLADLENALVARFKPSYKKLISFLREQQTSAAVSEGVWKFPAGESFYNYKLLDVNSIPIAAEEVFELGMTEVERIQTEILMIMEQVGFEGSLADFFEHMRSSDQFYYENTEKNKEFILDSINALVKNMEPRIDEFFNTQPKADLIVKAVEPYREKTSGYAFYQRPAIDGSRPGIYYINLYDLQAVPFFELEAVTYHEAIPGHHFNISISQELEGIPDFMKHQTNTAHTEGWGLYCELLAKEMGMYENPYADFGRLNLELFRACRLVVDAGIHQKKWDREKAVKFYFDNTSSSRHTCESMVDRHMVMPGQATAYKIGMLKILELRGKAATELGEQFHIADFHDAILTHGLLPLEIVERMVDDYIASKKAV